MAKEITDGNISEILTKNNITIVQFSAPWCGPCKVLGPIIDELSEMNSDIIIGKMNIDENQETPKSMGIRGIPTVIFYKNGIEVNRVVGLKTKNELQVMIDTIKV